MGGHGPAEGNGIYNAEPRVVFHTVQNCFKGKQAGLHRSNGAAVIQNENNQGGSKCLSHDWRFSDRLPSLSVSPRSCSARTSPLHRRLASPPCSQGLSTTRREQPSLRC